MTVVIIKQVFNISHNFKSNKFFLERSYRAYGLGSVLLFVQSFWKLNQEKKSSFPKRDFTAIRAI